MTNSDFTTTDKLTRIAGYRFDIRLRQNKTLPETITYNDCTMDVQRKDDIKFCNYCKKYGHLISKYRFRLNDEEKSRKRREKQEDKLEQFEIEINEIDDDKKKN